MPQIVKCELCRHRATEADGPSRREPGVHEVCPRERGDLRQARGAAARGEAARRRRRRSATCRRSTARTTAAARRCSTSRPVPFEKLGLPALGDESQARVLRARASHAPYLQRLHRPSALYAALAFVMRRNTKTGRPPSTEEGELDDRRTHIRSRRRAAVRPPMTRPAGAVRRRRAADRLPASFAGLGAATA